MIRFRLRIDDVGNFGDEIGIVRLACGWIAMHGTSTKLAPYSPMAAVL